ncbi:MAG TPA: biosynthetic peptidoglycan transglycosylase [Chloroflexota bacterium]|nr:biosynthetic peptidoglycan transglycosylase [Chloroflexota bacterium]
MWCAVLLVVALLAAWVYVLNTYAPGLRAEVRGVPALVETQLAQQHARYVPLAGISPNLQHAIVAIEDHRFYSHPGIDPISIVRAFWVNLTSKQVDQGGSTLEEQLVKRAFVLDDRSPRAKLREMGLAWAADQEFSKARILELYLNAAYYGRGAYGVGEAAGVYFGRDPAHLTLAQAAFLAALPQAPTVYGANPTSTTIQERWRSVLRAMVKYGYSTAEEARTAEATPLTFALPNP